MRSLKWFVYFILFSTSIAYTQEEFSIVEVPLQVTRRQVQTKTLLPFPINQIVGTQKFAAFVSHRKVWIIRPGKGTAPLSDIEPLPEGFDWYQTACTTGNTLVVGVSNYSEEQRKRDQTQRRGGFVAGPKPAGIIIVEFDPLKIEFIPKFKVVARPPLPEGYAASKEITPDVRSCLWDNNRLYVGGYGNLISLNLDSKTAEIIEDDLDEEGATRTSIWKERKTIWYTADEGGLSGTWITRIEDGKSENYRLLNYYLTVPDSILRYKNRLLTSSLAGVVEIDETKKTFIHYKLTEDEKKMHVYNLSAIKNRLWGVREDGFVKFDLEKKSATHFQLQGSNVSNNIDSIGYFGGRWYIGTDKELVQVIEDISK